MTKPDVLVQAHEVLSEAEKVNGTQVVVPVDLLRDLLLEVGASAESEGKLAEALDGFASRAGAAAARAEKAETEIAEREAERVVLHGLLHRAAETMAHAVDWGRCDLTGSIANGGVGAVGYQSRLNALEPVAAELYSWVTAGLAP